MVKCMSQRDLKVLQPVGIQVDRFRLIAEYGDTWEAKPSAL